MEEETEFDTKTEYGSIKTVENASVPYFGTIFNWLWVLILVLKKYGSIETVKNALNLLEFKGQVCYLHLVVGSYCTLNSLLNVPLADTSHE